MNPTVTRKIEAFFADFPLRRYQKGQILIQPHDNPSHVFHLVEGRVKQYDISARGDEVVLNSFGPPAFFPMAYAINRLPNQFVYEAEVDVVLHLAPLDDVVDFIKRHPDVMYDLLARVYRGTDGLLGRLAHLMGGSARSRILHELLIECRRFGHPLGAADGSPGQGVSITLTETNLASRAGLARETVSREIAKLKHEGLINVTHDGIVITNLDQLSNSVSQAL